MYNLLLLLQFIDFSDNLFNALFLLGTNKEALTSGLSDMDYLRSKVTQTVNTLEEEEEKSDGEEEQEEEGDEDPILLQHTDSAYESGENSSKAKTPVLCKTKESKTKKSEKQEVCAINNDCTELLCFFFTCISHLTCFPAAGTSDSIHCEVTRSPVQCERGDRQRAAGLERHHFGLALFCTFCTFWLDFYDSYKFENSWPLWSRQQSESERMTVEIEQVGYSFVEW